MPTNERFAAQTLQEIYQAMTEQPTDFVAHPPSHVSVILRQADGTLSNPFGGAVRNGYVFKLTVESPTDWSAVAFPVVYKRTGIRQFYIDETGILLGSDSYDGGTWSMPEI